MHIFDYVLILIVVCTIFQIGTVENLPLGEGLKEDVNALIMPRPTEGGKGDIVLALSVRPEDFRVRSHIFGLLW